MSTKHLTPEQELKAVALVKAGYPQAAVAIRMGVSRSVINLLINPPKKKGYAHAREIH